MEKDKRRQSIESLSRATTEIMSRLGETSLDEILVLIAQRTAELLDGESCEVFVVNREGFLSLEAAHGYDPGSFQKGLQIPVVNVSRGGLTGYIAHEGKVFRLHGEALANHPAVAGKARPPSQSRECHSLLAVPLKDKDGDSERLIGLLRVVNKRSDTGRAAPEVFFNAEDEWLSRIFGTYVAIALLKAKLFEQINKARDTARTVADLSSIGDLDGALNSIVVATHKALNCDAVTLYIFDPHRNKLSYPPVVSGVTQPESAQRLEGVPPESVVYRILSLNEMYFAEDVASDPFLSGRFSRREGIASCAAIPLIVHDGKVGIMFVNYRDPHRFTIDELTNIKLFAQQTAVAIRNAQLFQDAARRVQMLAALNNAASRVSGSLNETKILQRIAEETAQLIFRGDEDRGKNYVSIWLIEDLVVRLAVTLPLGPQGVVPVIETDLREGGTKQLGIVGRVVGALQTHVVHDVGHDSDYVSLHPETRSQAAVPILIGDKLIGVLSVESYEPHSFDSVEIIALQSLAAQAAAAIQNARQHKELLSAQRMVGTRTALAVMGMVTAVWGHDLANRVGTILNYSEGLRHLLNESKIEDGLKSDILEAVDAIAESSSQIGEVPTTAMLSWADTTHTVDINEFISSYVAQLNLKARYAEIDLALKLNPGGSLRVRADPRWLKSAIDVLASNAATAISLSPEKSLTISTASRDGWVDIEFTDTGGGVSPEVLPSLFNEVIKKNKDEGGSGVGLLIAATVVETYGGRLRLKETSARGSTFVISLPLLQ